MPFYGFPLFHKVGRLGFMLGAPVFIPMGMYIKDRMAKVRVTPVNHAVLKTSRVELENLVKFNNDAYKAYRNARKDFDTLINQLLINHGIHPQHIHSPSQFEEYIDRKPKHLFDVEISAALVKLYVTANLLLRTVELRGMELELLGKDHPDFTRKMGELGPLLGQGLEHLLVTDITQATSALANDEEGRQMLFPFPIEELIKNTVEVRWRYSFGLISVPESVPSSAVTKKEGSDLNWITFTEHRLGWSQDLKEDSN